MGDRYLVSGAQLGAMIAFAELNQNDRIKEVINEICEHQLVGNTRNHLLTDVQKTVVR